MDKMEKEKASGRQNLYKNKGKDTEASLCRCFRDLEKFVFRLRSRAHDLKSRRRTLDQNYRIKY